MKENKAKITLEGCEEYIKKMKEMKEATAIFRKEVEQLNESLDKTVKLLSCLR